MNHFIKAGGSDHRAHRNLRLCVATAVLSISFCGAAHAETDRVDAKLAIERAQADVDLISRESPAATHDQSFSTAQKKLADAHAAAAKDNYRDAKWLANEAELLADTTAGTANLAALEQTRRQISHDVDVLDSELSKSQQGK